MQMQRRGFLKAFLGAAVGAAIVPNIPLSYIAPVKSLPTKGAITYAQLEKAYMDACMGSAMEPTYMICSKSTYERMKQLYPESFTKLVEDEEREEPLPVWATYGGQTRTTWKG